MQEHLIELCIGETLQVGRYRVTLLQVDGDQLSVEIDGDDGNGWNHENSQDLEFALSAISL